jgi:glycerol-3-phosphate cytidylyltransferase
VEKNKKPYFDYDKRKHLLGAVRYVDLVIPEQSWKQKETDIEKYDVDIFVIGNDWGGRFDFLKSRCEVIYMQCTGEISTTKIKADLQAPPYVLVSNNSPGATTCFPPLARCA